MAVLNIKLKSNQEFITLQSVLQVSNVISTGGMAKAFLEEEDVYVNGELERRRGRKLYPDDEVEVLGLKIVIKKP